MDTYKKSGKVKRLVVLMLILSSLAACSGCSKKAKKVTIEEFEEYCEKNGYYTHTGVDSCFGLSRKDFPREKDVMIAADDDSGRNGYYNIQIGYYRYKNESDAEKTLNMIINRDQASLSYVDDYEGGIKRSGEKAVCDVEVEIGREEKRVYYVIVIVDDTLIYASTNNNKNTTEKMVKRVDKIINDLCY